MRYDDLARGESGGVRQLRGMPSAVLPDVFSPATHFSKLFTFQSYFDATLLERAILTQNPNDPIIASTEDSSQESGYSLGLHPSSQTPIAVQFLQGGMPASSVLFLKPGQIITPFGRPNPNQASQFSGFRYGLPMGWLGGGLATICVFHTPKAIATWTENAELLFQKVTVPIIALAAVTSAANNNARRNWPMRFPWSQALRGSSGVNQASNPVLAISPTKVLARLRGVTSLASSYAVRCIFQASNDFGLDNAGAVVNTNTPFIDIYWDIFSSIGTSGNLATQTPFKGMPAEFVRIAADDGGLAIIDNSAAAAFASGSIDFVRYGTL